jgi:hypothetical protein
MPTADHVTISGLQEYGAFLLPSARLQLQATLVGSDGARIDCTASAKWSSADERVVAFNLVSSGFFRGLAPGEIYARDKGSSAISATCGDLTGQATAMVDEFSLNGQVKVGTQPLPGATVVADRLATTDAMGQFEIHELFQREIKLVVSYPGYLNFAESIVWDGQPTMNVDVQLLPLPGTRILDGTDQVGKSDPVKHPFRVLEPGTLRLDTYFDKYDYNDDLFIELRCGDQLIASVAQNSVSRGKAFEVPARTDCAYELSFRQQSHYSLFIVQYILTLTR